MMQQERQKVYRLSYLSKANTSFRPDDINRLIEHSNSNNLAIGVSGYLAYLNPVFFQYLEGDARDVLGLMQRIQDDPRHSILTIVDLGEGERRVFADRGLFGEISERSISPALADMLFDSEKFIYGDEMQRKLALGMVQTVAEQYRFLDEIKTEAMHTRPGANQGYSEDRIT